MNAPLSGCVILSARRSGARVLQRLLAPLLPLPSAGSEPFVWHHPLGQVSRQFHQADPALAPARVLLDEALARPVFFHHNHDIESGEFNLFVLDGLVRAGYRVLRVQRDPAERLVSACVAALLEAPEAADIARWRARLQAGGSVPEPDEALLRQGVRQDLAYERWFAEQLAARPLPVRTLRHEALFRAGTAVLGTFDQALAFAGGGDRRARVDDAALLRQLLSGAHHSAGLRAWSPALARAHAIIVDEVAKHA